MYVTLNVQQIERKNIVVIRVQRGISRSYYIVEKGLKPSSIYICQGNSLIPASKDCIRQMIKETNGDSFEKLRSLKREQEKIESLIFQSKEQRAEKKFKNT